MSEKWTKGPWSIEPRRYGSNAGISAEDWGNLARVVVRLYQDKEDSLEGLANAYLIAAAPTLYEALKKCLADELRRRKYLKDGSPAAGYSDERVAQVQAALRQARGEGEG